MFNPPERLLKTIDFKRHGVEIILPTLFEEVSDYYAFFIMMVSGGLDEFFRKSQEELPAFKHRVLLILGEAVMNAAEHGNQGNPDKNIEVGFWLGRGGVLLAVRDKGDFYRKDTTKKLVESRTILKSTKKEPSGLGMDEIYQADEIFVDTEENSLYLLVLVNSTVQQKI